MAVPPPAPLVRRRRSSWRLLPHASDVRLRAEGPDLGAAFGAAVEGLAAVVAGGRPPASLEEREVAVAGDDPGGLLVMLLGECLYRLEVDGWLACGARVAFPAPGRCAGTLLGRPFDPAALGAGRPVKAATWHDLVVRTDDAGAVVEVLLDL